MFTTYLNLIHYVLLEKVGERQAGRQRSSRRSSGRKRQGSDEPTTWRPIHPHSCLPLHSVHAWKKRRGSLVAGQCQGASPGGRPAGRSGIKTATGRNMGMMNNRVAVHVQWQGQGSPTRYHLLRVHPEEATSVATEVVEKSRSTDNADR